MHSRVFLAIDSFMVHDNPRPRNQSQKSKVDWCLETDHNCISIRDKPDAFFRAGKMHLPDKAIAERHMPKCILGGWNNAFGELSLQI